MSTHSGAIIDPNNTFDVSYAKAIKQILTDGFDITAGRTADSFRMLPALQVRHDMRAGFPLLTLRKMYFRAIKVELLGFLQGQTDKRWYQERRCGIWDEWCNPTKVPYSKDDLDAQEAMRLENDLGPIYGAQLRDFRDYRELPDNKDTGVDQLSSVLSELERNPFSRRLVVSYWNPTAIHLMALPTCHFAWQLMVTGRAMDGRHILTIEWHQRSSDLCLGTPFNMAHYALLLALICELPAFKTKFVPGHVIGNLGHAHVYGKHVEEDIAAVVSRKPFASPTLVFNTPVDSVTDWDPDLVTLVDYTAHPKSEFTIAI